MHSLVTPFSGVRELPALDPSSESLLALPCTPSPFTIGTTFLSNLLPLQEELPKEELPAGRVTYRKSYHNVSISVEIDRKERNCSKRSIKLTVASLFFTITNSASLPSIVFSSTQSIRDNSVWVGEKFYYYSK